MHAATDCCGASGSEMINWDDLRFFLDAVRAGTYTAAGPRLNVNRTTVGRRLQRLERQLGISLFEQTPSVYQPTEAGSAALKAARAVEREIERLMDQLKALEERPAAAIRLAASSDIGPEFLAGLAEFRRARPDVHLELLGARDGQDSVTQRRSDIGIALLETRPPQHLRGVLVGKVAQAPYASPDYLAAHPADQPLSQHLWIAWGAEMRLAMPAGWANLAERAGGDVVVRVNSWPALKEAAVSGLGVAYLWCFVGDREPGLVRLRPPKPRQSTMLWLLMRRDVPQDARTEAVLKSLAGSLSARLTPAPPA